MQGALAMVHTQGIVDARGRGDEEGQQEREATRKRGRQRGEADSQAKRQARRRLGEKARAKCDNQAKCQARHNEWEEGTGRGASLGDPRHIRTRRVGSAWGRSGDKRRGWAR